MKIKKKKIREKWRKEDGKFGPGNPGKPQGAIHAKTKFINSMLGCFDEDVQKAFKLLLLNKRTSLEALDRVIRVANIGPETDPESAEQMPQMRIIIEGSNDTTKPMATEKKPG